MSAMRTGASSSKLTPKQQRFVDEYLKDLNATRAAVRAGYSARTADRIAHETLRRPAVAKAVERAKAERAERVRVDADWVLRRLVAQADADMADLYDEAGNLRHPKEWPEVWRTGLVAGVESFMVPKGQDGEGKPIYAEVRKVRLADRTRIVEMIGKHVAVGAFREQVGVSSPEGGPVQVEEKSTAHLAALLEKVKARWNPPQVGESKDEGGPR